MIKQLFKRYSQLPPSVGYLVAGMFMLHLVNLSNIQILNIYLKKLGFADASIANFWSSRYLLVVLAALPFGLLIRNRKLKPFFLAAGFAIPLLTLAILAAIKQGNERLIHLCMMGWGFCFAATQVSLVPYFLRNVKKELQTEAIALGFSTWSIAAVVSGAVIFLYSQYNDQYIIEPQVLTGFAFVGFLSLVLFFKLDSKENVQKVSTKKGLKEFDWKLIGTVLFPTCMIAVGAGLTIQFVNLFFFSVFGLDSGGFSLLTAATSILVFFGSLMVPLIKKRYGLKIGITLSQSLSVCALLLLASTEFFSEYRWVFYLAIFFYLVRQPLMNMAGPLTTELSMNIVGKTNQEMVAALQTTIWSGSWFLSGKMFGFLRQMDMRYAYIFYLTGVLYIIGVILYYRLVKKYESKI